MSSVRHSQIFGGCRFTRRSISTFDSRSSRKRELLRLDESSLPNQRVGKRRDKAEGRLLEKKRKYIRRETRCFFK